MLRIDQQQADLRVSDDVLDRRRRKLEIDRHDHQARAHDTEPGNQVRRAVGGQNANTRATCKPRSSEPLRERVCVVLHARVGVMRRAPVGGNLDQPGRLRDAFARRDIP